MTTPLVSVLMPAYNRERYIVSAIESVLAQTFEDFELIIVDDCSSDRSFEIARQHETDPRVKTARNDRNLGQFPNRTRAAELARGTYLKYVDSDDLIYRHSLAIMVEAIEAHPDAALALSHSSSEAEQPYPWKPTPVEAWRRQIPGTRLPERGTFGGHPAARCLFRRRRLWQLGCD